MTYQQVRDVITEIRESHRQLREALEQSQMQSHDSHTQTMLKALRREEQELELALARYRAEGEDALLDTWLQFIPDEQLWDALASIEFTPDMSADEVIARKLEFDRALTLLLRQLSEETSVPRVQEFFGHLLETVESRAARQAWSVREFQGGAEPPQGDE